MLDHDLKTLVVPVGFQCSGQGLCQVTSSPSEESGVMANKTSLTKNPKNVAVSELKIDEFHPSSSLLNTSTSSGVPVSPLMADSFCNITLVWQLKRQELWGRLFNAVLNNTDKKLNTKCCVMSLMAVNSGEMQKVEMIKQPPFTPLVFMHNDAGFNYMVKHIHFSPGTPPLFSQQTRSVNWY